jgi:hypothetical protein
MGHCRQKIILSIMHMRRSVTDNVDVTDNADNMGGLRNNNRNNYM